MYDLYSTHMFEEKYTYTGSDCAIVISSEGRTLVLALETGEETRALYEALLKRVN